MKSTSTISSKGQVTIPIEVRRRLGLKEGDRVEFVSEQDSTVLRRARPPDNPFEAYIGALPAFRTRKQINSWIRELRDDDSHCQEPS